MARGVLLTAGLPPALLRYLGGPADHFARRILAQSDADTINEAAWRARGQWDCNERAGYAAWHALADHVRERAGLPTFAAQWTAGTWGHDEYWHYRGRSPMPPALTAQERADLYCSSHPGIDAGGE